MERGKVGWACGRDIDARERIGSLAPELAALARADRRVEISQLLDALREEGDLDAAAFDALHRALDARVDDTAAYGELVRGAYGFLARSNAKIVLVQLDDAACELDQVNLPGTFDEYPNWRRKTRLDLDGIASDASIAALLAGVNARVKGDTGT